MSELQEFFESKESNSQGPHQSNNVLIPLIQGEAAGVD